MFPIGEFSKISGLSIKALRLYHEQAILVPEVVSSDTGYRYYDYRSVEKARVISLLRQMLFSLEEIKNLLAQGGDDSDAIAFLEHHKVRLDNKIREMKNAQQSIGRLIESERAAKILLSQNDYPIELKTLNPQLVAGIRMKGKFSDCGAAFGRLARLMGGNISGKPFNLFFDVDYKDDQGEFESCFPIKREKSAPGVHVRKLEGGRAVTLLHKGPYERVGATYARMFSYIHEKGLKALTPSRETYLKGPGMIFKGRPSHYLTEMQVFVESCCGR